jgi:hypothetical protein
MKKTLLIILSILLSSAFLASCSTVRDKLATKQVTQKTLDDGTTLRIGIRPPPAENQCMQLAMTGKTWDGKRLPGEPNIFQGGMTGLEDSAAKYASYHHLKADYAYMNLPTRTEINGFNVNFHSTKVTYYKCKKLVGYL